MAPTRRDFLKGSLVGLAAVALPVTAVAEPMPSLDGHVFISASNGAHAWGKLAMVDGVLTISIYEGLDERRELIDPAVTAIPLPPEVARSLAMAMLGR